MATNDDKKGGKRAAGAGFIDSDFANSVKESAQQIWLAGLGAFAKAQAEGGKVFDTLVKDGINLQKKTQAAGEEKVAEAGSKWADIASEVQSKAGQQWDKLETLFEERTARALGRLGVPKAKDIDALAQRIDALSEQVAKLAAVSKKPAAKSAAPAKTAAKKTSLKKAPVKRAPKA